MASRCARWGLDLMLGKISSLEDARKNWNRLPGEEVEPPSQEVFQKMYRCDA